MERLLRGFTVTTFIGLCAVASVIPVNAEMKMNGSPVELDARNVLAILGVIDGIMSIYDSISSRWGPSEIEELYKGFEEASYQLDEINQKLDMMMAQINVGFIKANLADDLKIISDCDFSLRSYLFCLNATGDDEASCGRQKDIFIANAEGATRNQLENAIRHIMESMAGNVQGNDIPRTYREALENYEHKLVEQLDQWMAWINMGMYVHAAYVQTKEITAAENEFYRSYLDMAYSIEVPVKRSLECELCRDESNVPNEINQVLHDCQSLSNEETLVQLHFKLSDKYRTKKWFAVVYNDIGGYENHCFNDDMPSSLHQWGKNAFVYSVAGDPTILQSDKDYLNQHLNDKYCFSKANADDYSSRCLDSNANAESAYNSLNAGTGGRLIMAVIKRYNGLWGQWDNSLDTYFENGQFYTVIALPPSAQLYHIDVGSSGAVVGH